MAKMYVVQDRGYDCNRRGEEARVRAESASQAAIRGAIKLGIRTEGRRPKMANLISGTTFAVYVASKDGGWNKAGCVYVS
jgi:hypothetical protein